MNGFDDLRQRRTAPGPGTTVWDVVWTYDLHRYRSLTAEQWSAMETRLHRFVTDLPSSVIQAQAVQATFDAVVLDLKSITGETLDEGGVFEYGGLNELFGEVMRRYGHPVELDEYVQRSNFVYPDQGPVG